MLRIGEENEARWSAHVKSLKRGPGDPLTKVFIVETDCANVRTRSEETATSQESVHSASLDGIEHFCLRPAVEIVFRVAHLLGMSDQLEEASFFLEVGERELLFVVVPPDVAALDELHPRLLGADRHAFRGVDSVERPR